MKTQFIILWIFMSTTNALFPQDDQKYDRDLPLLIIKKKSFDSIISESVYRLQKCDNTKSYVFSVNIKVVNDDIYCDIRSCDRQKFVLVDRFLKPYGYFLHEGYLFFVFCDFSPDWFEKSNESRTFTFNDFSGIFYAIEYPAWLYFYDGHSFYLVTAINECY